MSGQRQNTEDRTGQYGGDDGAMEHERADTTRGEAPGISERASSGKSQAERKQDDDLATGEENPG